MKRKTYLGHLLICLLSCTNLIFISLRVQARPLTLDLVTSPLNVQAIKIGTIKCITITARVDSEDVQFTWTLEGPGQIEEDTPPRKAFFRPPEQLATESAEATITVSATDARGDTARDSITFTLHSARATVTATPPKLPPTPTPTQASPEIMQLLNTADAYFQRTFYTEPEGRNALSLYKQVLERDPGNQHALEKIYTMADNYKLWGERDDRQQEYLRARQYYERYLLIAEYLRTTYYAPQVTQGIHVVQQRLQQLELLAPPPTHPTSLPSPPILPTATPTPTPSPLPPTPTPTPTVKPTPTPTVSLVDQLLERAEACFERKQYTTPDKNNAFDQYKAVLQIDPSNQHARSRLYDIANIYKDWGDSAYAQQNCPKAQTYYARYLSVTQYMQDRFIDRALNNEIQRIQERIQECFAPPATPTPTPPPLPPKKPTIPPVNCPSQTNDLNELLQQTFPEYLEQYKELKNQENQETEDFHQQLITTIEHIVCDLLAIEHILQEHYNQTKDHNLLQRLQKVQQTRENFEEERNNHVIIMKP